MTRLKIALILLHIGAVFSQTSPSKSLKFLENYDRYAAPRGANGEPVKVFVNMYIRSINALDEEANAVDMQITFRTEWKDRRLRYTPDAVDERYITIPDHRLIWSPDIFFSNAKTGFRNGVFRPNALIRVYPDGSVLYSNRISLQLTCKTEPNMFPFDKLTCPVIAASYGLTTDVQEMDWKALDPVQMSSHLRFQLVNFDLKVIKTDGCMARTKTGEYGCLKATLFYERTSFRTYFFFLYLPSLGLVILSWLTFFVNRRASDIVRLTLTLTFTLLMALICTSLWHIRPHYSYITPADIWVFTSAVFVFYALLHYVATRFVPCLSGSSGGDVEFGDKGTESFLKVAEEKEIVKNTERLKRFFRKNKADLVARVLYPVTYIIFSIVYTIYYMS